MHFLLISFSNDMSLYYKYEDVYLHCEVLDMYPTVSRTKILYVFIDAQLEVLGTCSRVCLTQTRQLLRSALAS